MTRIRPALRDSSSWSLETIEGFLDRAEIPVRLAFLTESGSPLICSLWFRYDTGRIYCATQASARTVALVRENPVVAFEIAGDDMPYRGVRGQGQVTVSQAEGSRTLRSLMARYLPNTDSEFAHWLEARADKEVALVIEPKWLTSWDFSSRMGDS